MATRARDALESTVYRTIQCISGLHLHTVCIMHTWITPAYCMQHAHLDYTCILYATCTPGLHLHTVCIMHTWITPAYCM
jgi:hypothetical protein